MCITFLKYHGYHVLDGQLRCSPASLTTCSTVQTTSCGCLDVRPFELLCIVAHEQEIKKKS